MQIQSDRGGDMMKKPSKLAVTLNALCAVIWSVKVILEVIYRTYNSSAVMFGVDILCAIILIVSFIVNLKQYRFNKE